MPNSSFQRLKPNAQCQARVHRIALDLVPIRVGEGGTGSGIWTYARELLNAMDGQIPEGMEILCLLNEGQIPFLSNLQHIRLVPFRSGGKNVFRRLFWVHVRVPLYCLFNRVHVLHKLATDTPFFCPAKRVTTVHDFYYEYLMEQRAPESIRLYERFEKFYFSWVTKICFRKSSAIIAVSQAIRDEAVRRFPEAADRISVIYHGSLGSRCQQETIVDATSSSHDLQMISDGDVASTKPDAFRVLCVAKFMEHKGQHLLIEAFERLLSQHLDLVGQVRLRLRGFHNDADYYERICQQVSASPYKALIQIEPFNPSDSLESIYSGAHLVVLLSDYEGFGLPVLEAQGVGVPVLCSNLSVLREVGGTGAVYVDRNDTVAIASAFEQIIEDQIFYNEMKERAKANTARFSWDKAAEETLALYLNVTE